MKLANAIRAIDDHLDRIDSHILRMESLAEDIRDHGVLLAQQLKQPKGPLNGVLRENENKEKT